MSDIYEEYPWEDSRMWEQWPKDRSKPTLEEFKEAEKRYQDEIKKNDERLARERKVDWSDWRCGLIFVMSTYSRFVWWSLFFPNEEVKDEQRINIII